MTKVWSFQNQIVQGISDQCEEWNWWVYSSYWAQRGIDKNKVDFKPNFNRIFISSI